MKKPADKPLLIVGILSCIEISIVGFMIASIPSDPKNEFILGISAYRFINLIVILLLETFILVVLLQKKLLSKIGERVYSFLKTHANWAKSYWIASLFLFFFLILLQIPAYRLKDSRLLWERLIPNFLLGEMVTVTVLLFLSWIGIQKYHFSKDSERKIREFSKFLLPFAAIVSGLVILVVLTKIGIAKDPYHWNVAGVPILPSNVFLIFFGYLILIGIRNYFLKKPITVNTWIIGLVLWGLASFIWVAQPITRNIFVYQPKDTISGQFFPKSDAQRFDQGAELMLIGEGILGGVTEEKPFLMAVIGIVKFLGGGVYQNTANLQVVVLALIVPGLYLIGRELYSSQFGVVLSIVGILYEINTLNSSGIINNVHIKLFMSEPYSLLGMVWIVYFFIRWMKNPNNLHYGLITFALVGFFSYVRTNFLGVFLIVLLASIVLPKQNLSRNFKRSLAASLAVIGVNFPWAIYAYVKYGYIVVLNKIETIFRTRLGEDGLTSFAAKSAKTVLVENSSFLPLLNEMTEFLYISASHFFNNLIKSILIFPVNIRFDKIDILLDRPYWDENIVWDGSVSVIFFINLLLITVGIAVLYKKHRGVALLPLYLSLGYYLSLALGRTSGGRYLVPGIWVFYMYYFAGLFVVFETIALHIGWNLKIISDKRIAAVKPASKSLFSTIAIILMVGLAVPTANQLIPERYPDYSREELIELVNKNIQLNETNTDEQGLAKLVENWDGEMFYGEIHYPVRFKDHKNESQYHYDFSILGPSFSRYSQLASDQENLSLPVGAEVVGFGCRIEDSDHILLLYLVEEQAIIQSNISYQDICLIK